LKKKKTIKNLILREKKERGMEALSHLTRREDNHMCAVQASQISDIRFDPRVVI